MQYLCASVQKYCFVFFSIVLTVLYQITLPPPKVGKIKEEIYSLFRQRILDIQQLLVMRDNSPPSPDLFDHWGSTCKSNNYIVSKMINTKKDHKLQTLPTNHLGILLLHIHQYRNILLQSCRCFRLDVLRNVAEDLAELAGENGPIIVSQQLQIITRIVKHR